ncbi:hypothetical protein HS088_TW09G01023 [Tripterygium wilfordii]|uniref:Uncharacterized protein n=1 Tax=Tripterygium wilfordii TaxID=458696 RepID=A0A7J7D9H5_TRIWF|nr:hypothetical protein HS088_TW09G01023 [Tripterygium wilfordii]
MDIIRNWCNSGSETIQLGKSGSVNSTSSSRSKWKLLWNKLIKKKKERILEASRSVKVPYDEDTYSQNFDGGVTWDEPDGFFRSFSVRYADSSNKRCP